MPVVFVDYFTALSVPGIYSIEWYDDRCVMNYTGFGRK
jgi:hypothetical protein